VVWGEVNSKGTGSLPIAINLEQQAQQQPPQQPLSCSSRRSSGAAAAAAPVVSAAAAHEAPCRSLVNLSDITRPPKSHYAGPHLQVIHKHEAPYPHPRQA